MALGFLRSCDEMDETRFQLLFLVSLGYILGEILLIIGIDLIGRKWYLSKYVNSVIVKKNYDYIVSFPIISACCDEYLITSIFDIDQNLIQTEIRLRDKSHDKSIKLIEIILNRRGNIYYELF